MSRVYKDKDKDELGILRIRPEGWIDYLVFEFDGFSSCGQAEMGVGVRLNDDAGGVLTNDDLVDLRNSINRHLKRLGEFDESTSGR